MCTTSSKLNVMLHFYIFLFFYIYKPKKHYWKSFRSVIIVNALNKDLGLTVWYYHVTYAFQSESTLYSSLNVKQLLPWNKRDSWSLSDSNRIRAHIYLLCKRTLNHLAKWLSVCLRTKWLWVRIPLLSLKPRFNSNNVIRKSATYWKCTMLHTRTARHIHRRVFIHYLHKIL